MSVARRAGIASSDRLGAFVLTSDMLTHDRASLGFTRQRRYPRSVHLNLASLDAYIAELQDLADEMRRAAPPPLRRP